jgi:serpin B
MPFWKVEYYESVKEPLMKAGLAPLFEPRDEFRPIAKDVWVLDAFHRTWVDMNENGVEAAAATAVVVGRTSAPIGDPVDFHIDRPFFVVLRKRSTGAALFMGFIHQPTKF